MFFGNLELGASLVFGAWILVLFILPTLDPPLPAAYCTRERCARMGIVRPLPKSPWWTLPVTVAVILATFLSAGWFQSPWPFFGLALIIALGEWRGFRCPQCRRRLRSRDVPIDGGPAYQVFYECTSCEALWDGQMKFDPRD